MNKKEIGKQLKYFRQKAGLTQAELAEKININEKHISKIESGIHFPTFDNFIKILDVLNIKLKDLDTSEKKLCSKSREKLFRIINQSSDKDIEFYTSVIENLNKNLQKYRK